MGKYAERIEARATSWPDIHPANFPQLQEIVSERLKELEDAACSAADTARQGPSVSGGGLTWLVLAGVASFVFSHIHQDLGPFKNTFVADAIIAAWILFLAFLVPSILPGLLAFRSDDQSSYEKELAALVVSLLNQQGMTDQAATHAVRNLIWKQRSIVSAYAQNDLKWMRKSHTIYAVVSLLLVLDLLVIGAAFVFAPH